MWAEPILSCVLCAPDKLRGSLDARQAAAALARGARAAGARETIELPLADGGEGTLDVLLAAQGGERRRARVTGPLGEPVEAAYAVLADGTAVVEMALASGLALVHGANDPLGATTTGTGELIALAMADRPRRIVVAVGGSASVDGGRGALDALGWSLSGAEVVVACDVAARFVAAARVFGPQKGASPADVDLLEARLAAFADELAARTGRDVRRLRGSGAGGGLAGGLAALGARLERGFDLVSGAAGLAAALERCSGVLTAEGRLDRTSLDGKVVGGVLRAAHAASRPAAVIAGSVAVRALPGGARAYALLDRANDHADSRARAAELLEEVAASACAHLAQ